MKLSVLKPFSLTFILSMVVSAIPSTPSNGLPFLPDNSKSNVSTRAVYCYGHLPYVIAPTKTHCENAIDRILQSPDLMTSKTWSVPDRETPAAQWIFQTCLVEIRLPSNTPQELAPRQRDTFSEFSFVGQAQTIVKDCLTRGRGGKIGGTSIVGPKGVFQIIVRSTQNLASW